MTPIRTLALCMLDLAQARAELFGVELAQEAARLERLLILSACAALGLVLTIMLSSAFLIVCFWDDHRVLVTGCLALAAFFATTLATLKLQQASKRTTQMFADTRRAVKGDFDALHHAQSKHA